MKYGHSETQNIFLSLGEMIGYRTKRNFTPILQADGVWLTRHPIDCTRDIPIVAIEIAITESLKSLRGSIRTLELISPTIAILLIHEGEISARLLEKGVPMQKIIQKLSKMKSILENEINKSSKSFEIWNEHSLSYWFNVIKNEIADGGVQNDKQ